MKTAAACRFGRRSTAWLIQSVTEDLLKRMVVPAVEDTAVVYKERVATDRVRLNKRIHEDHEVLNIPAQTETLEVERVPVGRLVEVAPAIRQEGDTTVSGTPGASAGSIQEQGGFFD